MAKSKSLKSNKLKRRVDQLSTVDQKARLKAIALKYDVDKDKAPKITAIGKGSTAEMILKIAEDHQVPFYEDQSLTDLLSKLDINQEIPGQLYTLVAEVLAFVYQLDKLAKKRQRFKNKYAKKN